MVELRPKWQGKTDCCELPRKKFSWRSEFAGEIGARIAWRSGPASAGGDEHKEFRPAPRNTRLARVGTSERPVTSRRRIWACQGKLSGAPRAH